MSSLSYISEKVDVKPRIIVVEEMDFKEVPKTFLRAPCLVFLDTHPRIVQASITSVGTFEITGELLASFIMFVSLSLDSNGIRNHCEYHMNREGFGWL